VLKVFPDRAVDVGHSASGWKGWITKQRVSQPEHPWLLLLTWLAMSQRSGHAWSWTGW
jgi:hypothetical protein